MTETIGFIGTGRIAEPMVRSISRQFPHDRILVSERTSGISSSLSQLDNVSIADNEIIAAQSDIVLLCVLADVARDILPQLTFKSGQEIISVMADIDLQEVAALTHPANAPCVTIPLPFIDTGKCPLPVFPHSPALTRLFGDENEIITVASEQAIPPHFAATAILSTTMKQLSTVSQWLGHLTGNNVDGERYVASLLSGYLGALEKDGQQRFVEAMEDLSTEGGLNNQLRSHITDSGHFEHLAVGLDALNERLTGKD